MSFKDKSHFILQYEKLSFWPEIQLWFQAWGCWKMQQWLDIIRVTIVTHVTQSVSKFDAGGRPSFFQLYFFGAPVCEVLYLGTHWAYWVLNEEMCGGIKPLLQVHDEDIAPYPYTTY